MKYGSRLERVLSFCSRLGLRLSTCSFYTRSNQTITNQVNFHLLLYFKFPAFTRNNLFTYNKTLKKFKEFTIHNRSLFKQYNVSNNFIIHVPKKFSRKKLNPITI